MRDDLIKGGAIDLDHRERMVFWSDNALWTLNRMSLVTGESEVKESSTFSFFLTSTVNRTLGDSVT